MNLPRLTNNLQRGLVLLLSAGATMLTVGCSAIDQAYQSDQPARSDGEFRSAEGKECLDWFRKLDEAVDRAGVRDAEAYRVPGFPYLRVNRFLASFRQQASNDPAAFSAWQKRLRALDERSRSYEISNLPQGQLATLEVSSRPEVTGRTNQCAGSLATLDAASVSRRRLLTERAHVPDDYDELKRTVGVYPVVSMAFFEFAKKWQNESAGTFQQTAAGTFEQKNIVRYRPPDNALPAQRIASILSNAKTDTLGIPEIGDRERETLFATFAPVYEIDTSGDYDRFGPLRWGAGETPEVDVSRPTVYRRLAYTRYGGRSLMQLVYMIWFTERPQNNSLDPLSGKLDGIAFRVTLNQSGRPLVYDSIHLCGCYHMFFPTPAVSPIPPPDPNVEWAFVPRTLPVIEAPQRVVVRMTTRSHYLIDVHPDVGGDGTNYAMANDSELRTIPTADGTRSAFGPTGIVPGTDRGERLVTWPLGIESAGAMREWGRHATALVGRRQFDDADLIERRFQISPPGG
jgi:hypothetical protein